MTSLNKHSSNGSTATLQPRSGSTPPEGSVGDVRLYGGAMTSSWEALISEIATPHKRLFVLAHEQGLLHDYFQPWIQRPVPTTSEKNGSHSLSLVSRLLSESAPPGHAWSVAPEEWKPLHQSDHPVIHQALLCPDLFLLCHAGCADRKRTGTAQVIAQALKNGDRVLYASTNLDVLDAVLEQVTGTEEVFAFRCLAPREKIQDLPTAIRRLTFPERSRVLQDRTLSSAKQALDETTQTMNTLMAAEARWPRIITLGDHAKELSKQRDLLQEQLADIAGLVRAKKEAIVNGTEEPSRCQKAPFSQDFLQTVTDGTKTWKKRASDWDRELHELREIETAETEALQTVLAKLDPLRPMYQAKKHNRWWTAGWWKASPPDLLKDCESLEQQESEIQTKLKTLQQQIADKEQEKQQAKRDCETRWDQAIAQETETLRTILEQDQQTAKQKTESVHKEWDTLIAQLPEGELRPSDPLATDIRECFDRWQEASAGLQEKCQFLTEWVNYLQKNGSELAARLPKLANLVGGLPQAVLRDKRFGESAHDQHFDLLVVDLDNPPSEPDVQKLAARANRCVMLGNSRDAHKSSALFQRLWHVLYNGHERMHKRWIREAEAIRCQMVQVPEEARGELECETVADRPEVELCIFDVPETGPAIAEVKFPTNMSLAECKSFLFTELEEVAIQSEANCCWVEEDQRILLNFTGPEFPSDAISIELTPGVKEWYTPQPDADHLGLTLAIEFDRTKDWTLETAVDWVDQYCRAKFLGRTAFLP